MVRMVIVDDRKSAFGITVNKISLYDFGPEVVEIEVYKCAYVIMSASLSRPKSVGLLAVGVGKCKFESTELVMLEPII